MLHAIRLSLRRSVCMMNIHVGPSATRTNPLAGLRFDHSISVSFVFFFGLSASPDVRDLFALGLAESLAPVDDSSAVLVERRVLAGSAGPSMPDGRKNVAIPIPCVEEDCRKSVPTPVMSKMTFFASLEGSLVDFFDCLAVREPIPVDDIECSRLFFVCSVACWSAASGGAASVAVELEAWQRGHDG